MTRLDVWLTEHGLAESREKAQALVMAGRVRMNGQKATKPGTRVKEGADIEVDPGPAHVGRGALKLAGALDAFSVDVTDNQTILRFDPENGSFPNNPALPAVQYVPTSLRPPS